MTASKSYRYFDTPEGEDTLKKLWFVLKPAGVIAVGLSTVDVLSHSQPKGYLQTIGRYAYITLPILGMATAFVITTNLIVNIRQKDDKFNWVAGALVAGGLFGAWRRSAVAGVSACAGFSLLAVIKKHTLQQKWDIIPLNKPIAYGGLHASRYDFSLTHERPRNWTTTPTAES